MHKKLLIEIGTEELPAIPLLKELKNIKPKWQAILQEYRLESEFDFFYTPRRLVFFHPKFQSKQEDSTAEFIGAPKSVALDKDGKLTQAGLSFLQKAGISEKELSFKELKGKEVLYHQSKVKGKESKELLERMIDQFLKSLSFGKSMRWGSNDFEFIRAIRSLTCLLDDELVNMSVYGVKSEKKSFIHRSISYDKLEFNNIDEYFKLLEQNFVILDANKRKEKIINECKALEAEKNIIIADDAELLAEVVAITEYPKLLLGTFEEEFLQIPSEVISTSMRENQRYFSVFNNQKLSPHFAFVSNAVCDDYTQIIHGNERVLRARLSDAMFFWQNDLKTGLDPQKLEKMTYLDGLGTMADKVKREQALAEALCKFYPLKNKDELQKALLYAKTDLSTQMVYEFSELQGIMGSYYAKAMGFDDTFCLALKEQYLPNSEKGALPSSEFSSLVALCNKFDLLLGHFSLGKIPNGTKDPYALRRAANGVIKIILNLKQSFDLEVFLKEVVKAYKEFDTKLLKDFIFERLFTFYEVNPSFIKAVLSSKNSDLIHIDEAIKALIELSQKSDFNENFTTFKRLANIATKNEAQLDESLFVQDEEKELYKHFKLCQKQSLKESLEALFALKAQIDNFFDKVMINTEDKKLRLNRQALVYAIYLAFLNIADIKELSLN